jgi:selenide,water dikinase
MSREIVLVGGGHVHVEVIRRFGLKPIAGAKLTVIDPNSRPVYSGMILTPDTNELRLVVSFNST